MQNKMLGNKGQGDAAVTIAGEIEFMLSDWGQSAEGASSFSKRLVAFVVQHERFKELVSEVVSSAT
jgi:hypothetical protein